jgi:hypothetical protein
MSCKLKTTYPSLQTRGREREPNLYFMNTHQTKVLLHNFEYQNESVTRKKQIKQLV